MLVDLMVAVSGASASSRSHRLQQFAHAPNVIGDTSGHGRSNPKCLVDAAKVVEREPDHDGCAVVLKLLTETVREASESPKPHPYGEVLAFNVRRADPLR